MSRRTKEVIHNVIVYCKANPARTVIQAIDVILKEEKKYGGSSTLTLSLNRPGNRGRSPFPFRTVDCLARNRVREFNCGIPQGIWPGISQRRW